MDDAISPYPGVTLVPSPIAYAIELDGVSIGVAMPVRGGYVFRTAESIYLPLDGRRFRRLSQMHHAAGTLRRGKMPMRPA